MKDWMSTTGIGSSSLTWTMFGSGSVTNFSFFDLDLACVFLCLCTAVLLGYWTPQTGQMHSMREFCIDGQYKSNGASEHPCGISNMSSLSRTRCKSGRNSYFWPTSDGWIGTLPVGVNFAVAGQGRNRFGNTDSQLDLNGAQHSGPEHFTICNMYLDWRTWISTHFSSKISASLHLVPGSIAWASTLFPSITAGY